MTFSNHSKPTNTIFSSSRLNTFFKFCFLTAAWLKVRVLYYMNNWVYTTNHKRIGVNYFWFVILSGIFGMVLATVIRLELAYPGVGIFAGDSLQYLSLVTAHGVIMVFFMIIPLISGAFANFLLPTQLGVHDVAFPRLNSAAFWFLPGGLLMLGQLICIDRRYQRMNCFNIREIQSILKRRFFVDLINTHDHHDLLNKTMIGLKFKTNDLNFLNPNIFLFYNYGIEVGPKFRSNTYDNVLKSKDFITLSADSYFFKFICYFSTTLFTFFGFIFIRLIENFYFFTNFFLIYKTTYLSISIKVLNLTTYTWDDLNNSLNNLLNFSFFSTLSFSNVTNFIHRWFSDFGSRIFIYIISLVESHIKLYISWLRFKESLYEFENITQLIEFIKIHSLRLIRYLFGNNLVNTPHKKYSLVNIYEFFFIGQIVDTLRIQNKPVLDFNPLSSISYLDPRQLFYTISFYTDNFFTHSDKTPHFVTTTKLGVSDNAQPSLYFLYDKNSKIKTYWFNHFFYQRTSGTMGLRKTSLSPNIDYNSYTVYFHILINVMYNIPVFCIQLLCGLFNLKNFFYSLNSFYNFMSTWYVPLIFTDNAFNLHIRLTRNQALRSVFIKINEGLFYIWEHLFNFFKILYGKFIGVSLSRVNLTDLVSIFNLLILNTFFFLNDFIISIVTVLTILLFGLKTNLIFDKLYDYLLFGISENRSPFAPIFNNLSFSSNYFNNTTSYFQNKYNNEELSNSTRYWRFNNPVFKYDYKSGDYFPKLYKEIYTYLFTTILDLSSALRTSPWFFSDSYAEVFNNNFNNFLTNITETNLINLYTIHSWNASRLGFTDAFYYFFYTLNIENLFTNKRWVSLNTANQKFSHMFYGSSMQQRIYSNWRQLKFTREAWRCKLLAARHQKTLFRRFVNEDGVFWSIERNARDLLPGWAMITPFSSRVRYTAIGKTDIGLLGVFLVLNSSIISAANFLVTYRYLSTLNNRKMRDARSFFTEGILCSSWMMLAANPMLAIGILMLLSDRHWQTSFFDYSGGGDTVLFQHMFWFFGHPEVYIVIIPTFGFVNTILSYFLKKRVSARASLLYSMYTIAFLGFFVWGHHMYMVGLAHTTRMLFSTLTVMISVPAATKIMHWCVTIANSAFTLELPLLCVLTFIFLFVSGGISGMFVAHTGMDVLFHDTFYVIGHFHVMFAGAAMFGSFGAFYFYFPAIFGVKYSRLYAYLHYLYYLIGHLMTFIPMFWLGYAGMPRRVLDYPSAFGGWHSVISAGHMLSVAGLIAFFIMIFDSLRQARAAMRNTFGISRYNTRLNFYIFEAARSLHVQRKGFFLYRFLRPAAVKLNDHNYTNYEYLETTLISYTFTKRTPFRPRRSFMEPR